jgi:hydroxyethylthiazole kinase-like uncharacterized protein yjeF
MPTMARVTTAAQAAALDAATIAGGTPSFALMERAGRAAAGVILERFAEVHADGALILAGSGNNGGDGWVVALALLEQGCEVKVEPCGEPRTEDAREARARYLAARVDRPEFVDTPAVVVDALLGTGAVGAPRDAIAAAIQRVASHRATGASVVALDVPSGLDATTGAITGACVHADLTITVGSVKRGLLAQREPCGEIIAIDIGVTDGAEAARLPTLATGAQVAAWVPRIGAQAHKGVRKRLVIIGGAPGMAGATVLAARGAARSGVGMIRLCVAPASVAAVQAAEPAATAVSWPAAGSPDLRALCDYADVMLIGPGLGTSDEAQALVSHLLATFRGPVVLDADALNAFAGRIHALKLALETHAHRPAVLTPHPVELARLAAVSPGEVHTRRYEIVGETARSTGATVLLKGVPTVVSDGATTRVSAAGTAVLATAGSGDVLGGIVATLLAQTEDPLGAATCGAWVHGRAAEIAGAGRVRGIALDDVIQALAVAWPQPHGHRDGGTPVLAELPAVP